jgi:tetratricopeptide (TPR) repeat protein
MYIIGNKSFRKTNYDKVQNPLFLFCKMSERQRHITRYINDIPVIIKAKYRLHFLRTEKDSSAVHMLQESLSEMDKQYPHAGINSAVGSIKNSPNNKVLIGKYYSNEKDIGEKSGTKYMNMLLFENALEEFNKAIKKTNSADKFLTQRCDCYFMLDRFHNAYALALESNDKERIFLMSIAVGKFDVAQSMIPHLKFNVKKNKHEIVSLFELAQLLIIIYLSEKPIEETVQLFNELSSSPIRPDTPLLVELISCISNMKFAEAIVLVSDLHKLLEESIFTTSVADVLAARICDNIVSIAVMPFHSLSLGDVIDLTGLSKDDAVGSVKRGIRNGKIYGKLDLKEGILVRSQVGEQREQRKILDKIQIVLENFELYMWKTNK